MFRPLKKYPSRDTVPLTSSKLKHNYIFRRCVCLAGQHGQTSVCLQVRICFLQYFIFSIFQLEDFFAVTSQWKYLYIFAWRTSPLSSALPSSSKSSQKVHGRESNRESFKAYLRGYHLATPYFGCALKSFSMNCSDATLWTAWVQSPPPLSSTSPSPSTHSKSNQSQSIPSQQIEPIRIYPREVTEP